MSLCGSNVGNTGLQTCQVEFGKPIKAIWVPKGQGFATAAEALTAATWTTNLSATAANRWLPSPEIDDYENTDTEETVFVAGYGKEYITDDGKFGFGLKFYSLSIENIKEQRKLNSRDLDVFILTDKNYLLGKDTNQVGLYGFSSNVYVGKGAFANASDPSFSNIKIQLTDPNEWVDYGMYAKLEFDVDTIITGLVDLKTVTTAGATATACTITVTESSGSPEILDLVEADFTLLDITNSTVIVPTSVTVNGDGTYTYAYTTLPAGDYAATIFGAPDLTSEGYDLAPNGYDTFTIA